jgi:hypothetical protein
MQRQLGTRRQRNDEGINLTAMTALSKECGYFFGFCLTTQAW